MTLNGQNKSKIFLVIIAILLVTNIAMVGILLQEKEPVKPAWELRKAFISDFLQKEIGFNQQQLTEYDTLSTRNHVKISGLLDAIRDNKTANFKQMVAGGFTDSSLNAVADKSSAAQKVVSLTMFNHIRNIRKLCTADQVPKFDSLFIKIYNRKADGKKK